MVFHFNDNFDLIKGVWAPEVAYCLFSNSLSIEWYTGISWVSSWSFILLQIFSEPVNFENTGNLRLHKNTFFFSIKAQFTYRCLIEVKL